MKRVIGLVVVLVISVFLFSFVSASVEVAEDSVVISEYRVGEACSGSSRKRWNSGK